MEKTEKEKIGFEEKSSPAPMKLNCRHYLIFPVVFGVYFSLIINGYVQGEWTQMMVRREYFPDESANFSGCTNNNESDPRYKDYQTVQQVTANWGMLFSLAEHIPATFAQMILPPYTDVYGRKFLLVFGCLAMAIKNVAISFTVYYEASFWYLFAANVVLGCGGTGFAFGSACFSYTADITFTKTQRTIGVVATEAMIMIAVVASSYCSGLFIEDLDLGFFYTSVIGSSFTLLMVLLILLLGESLPAEKRSKHKPIIENIKRMTDFYISKDFEGKRKAYILLVITFGMATIITINRGSMETLYFLGRPFCWGPSKIGLFSMVRHAAKTACGLVSIWFLQKFLSNAAIGMIGSMSSIISYTIEGLATTTVWIYMVPVTGIFTFLIVPMIRTLMSALTPLDKQGSMFAGAATIEVICTLIAHLSQNAIYSFSLSFMNGFVFLMCAVFSLVNLLLMYFIKRTKQGQETCQETDATVSSKKLESEKF